MYPARVTRQCVIGFALLLGVSCGTGKKGTTSNAGDAAPAVSSVRIDAPDLDAAGDGAEANGIAHAESLITPKGGEIALGGARLLVPAGALQSSELITVTARSKSVDPADQDIVGDVYDFQPDGLTFAVPAILSINHVDGELGLRRDELVLASKSAGSTEWTTLDTWLTKGGVGAFISHFTDKAKKKPPRKVPPEPPCGYECGNCEYCNSEQKTCLPVSTEYAELSPLKCRCPSFPKECRTVNSQTCTCVTCLDRALTPCVGADGTSKCVNLKTDRNNCGACDTVVNTKIDRNNCGACGNVCPAGQVCDRLIGCSVCDAKSGDTYCPNTGDCSNHLYDDLNCGSCGNVCATGICVDGFCCQKCPAGQTCVNGTCSVVCGDVSNDPNNCGSCGNVCAAKTVCTNGKCSPMPCVGFFLSNIINEPACGLGRVKGELFRCDTLMKVQEYSCIAPSDTGCTGDCPPHP